jgi:hypothetical protein
VDLLFGPPVVLLIAAGLSLIGAARGHWSAPAVSLPVMSLGGLVFLALAMARAPLLLVMLAIVPVVVAVASMSLWPRAARAKNIERESALCWGADDSRARVAGSGT